MALNHVNQRSLRVGQRLVLARKAKVSEESAYVKVNEDLEEDLDDALTDEDIENTSNISEQDESLKKKNSWANGTVRMKYIYLLRWLPDS